MLLYASQDPIWSVLGLFVSNIGLVGHVNYFSPLCLVRRFLVILCRSVLRLINVGAKFFKENALNFTSKYVKYHF